MKYSLLLLISIILLSCDDDIVTTPEETKVDLTGSYYIDSKVEVFEVQYDSMGNIVYAGLVDYYRQDTIDILTFQNTIDSFSLWIPNSAKNEHNVVGQIQGDTLVIHEDYTVSGYVINYKKGKIWMTGDSLYIDYSRSYELVSHSGAFPNYGHTTAVGYLLD